MTPAEKMKAIAQERQKQLAQQMEQAGEADAMQAVAASANAGRMTVSMWLPSFCNKDRLCKQLSGAGYSVICEDEGAEYRFDIAWG